MRQSSFQTMLKACGLLWTTLYKGTLYARFKCDGTTFMVKRSYWNNRDRIWLPDVTVGLAELPSIAIMGAIVLRPLESKPLILMLNGACPFPELVKDIVSARSLHRCATSTLLVARRNAHVEPPDDSRRSEEPAHEPVEYFSEM